MHNADEYEGSRKRRISDYAAYEDDWVYKSQPHLPEADMGRTMAWYAAYRALHRSCANREPVSIELLD